ncbi:MAG: glycosyltransferase family 4 protein [Candidatus Eiseniibacteriota bacterium]
MRRRTALVLTPRLPWPLDDGGRVGLWQSVWTASKAYETIVVSLYNPDEPALPVPPSLAERQIEIVRIPHRPPSTTTGLWDGVFGRWPYTLARYRNHAFDAEVRRLVRERAPAIAIVNHLHLATYADAFGAVPWVLREHNVEFSWMRRFAASRRNPLVKAYANFSAARLARTEADLCRRAALVLAIQESEAREIARVAPEARVEIVPIGVDFARFRAPARDAPPIVLIVGSYAWRPNAEGVRRFLGEGWPEVRARIPDARLRVVGKDLPRALAGEIEAAGGESVGFVEDVAPEYARASVLVVPLWVGAGARVKIVEALAAGLPIVTTALGAEGLGLVDGVHAVYAEEPAALGRAAARVLSEPQRARRLEVEGRDWAARNFSLEAVARRTNELCERVLAERSRES